MALTKSPITPPSVDSTSINSVILQLESELFDLGCLYHGCHRQLRDKLQSLGDAERAITNLHSDLALLTECLEEAKSLLAHKDSMVDVAQYLKECKVTTREHYCTPFIALIIIRACSLIVID